MRRSSLFSVGVLATVLLAACPDRDVTRVDPVADRVDHRILRPLNRNLDILFVIDNSGSMAGEQASLAANFPAFIGVLQTIIGGLPDVHIGVVSSNVGAAGQASVPGCAGDGDDGKLLVKAACTGLTGQFISDVAGPGGTRVRNYTGNLDTLFSCMAQLGTGGCGFEMHLEAAYRALQPGANPGFYRPDAYLAVIVIADEDDCSTQMGAMFGDPTAGLGSALGPRTSFRCHEFGVQCDDDPSPRGFGTKRGCQPRAQSPYMVEVDQYIDFLKGLKSDPDLVIVAGIVGIDDDDHTVVVGPDPMTPANPSVGKSCFIADPADPNDGAAPPIRLATFLRAFPNRNQMTSICNATLQDALVDIGALVVDVVRNPCFDEPLADRDPRTACDPATGAGCEYECSVAEVRRPHADDREETLIPACADDGRTTPCWRVAPNPAECSHVPYQLGLDIDYGDAPEPTNTYVDFQCVLD